MKFNMWAQVNHTQSTHTHTWQSMRRMRNNQIQQGNGVQMKKGEGGKEECAGKATGREEGGKEGLGDCDRAVAGGVGDDGCDDKCCRVIQLWFVHWGRVGVRAHKCDCSSRVCACVCVCVWVSEWVGECPGQPATFRKSTFNCASAGWWSKQQ